jgi:hypothetical protein
MENSIAFCEVVYGSYWTWSDATLGSMLFEVVMLSNGCDVERRGGKWSEKWEVEKKESKEQKKKREENKEGFFSLRRENGERVRGSWEQFVEGRAKKGPFCSVETREERGK